LSKAGANELVRNMLSTIFTGAINWHFSNGLRVFVETLSSKKYGITPEQEQLIDGMLRQFKKQVLDYISDCTRDYIQHMKPLSNKYIKDQASELTDSLYSIIEPTGDKDLLRSIITNLTGRRPPNVSDEEITRLLNAGS
jgi:hypothetical protein